MAVDTRCFSHRRPSSRHLTDLVMPRLSAVLRNSMTASALSHQGCNCLAGLVEPRSEKVPIACHVRTRELHLVQEAPRMHRGRRPDSLTDACPPDSLSPKIQQWI